MKHFQILLLATIVALSIAPAKAQGEPAPVSPTAEAKPMDCGKTTMKRHDHAAERGGGSTAGSMQRNKPCPSDAAGSASKSTTQKGQRHDHTKTKNM